MTEKSMWWDTTSGIGDGAAKYTQDEWQQFVGDILLGRVTTDGVLANCASSLLVTDTGGASPLAVATGAACVCGRYYFNTGSVPVSVATPLVGTTGHTVILQMDWTLQTTRVALLSAADGNPTPPSVTQTINVKWEIALATLTITLGGAVTLTDVRKYARYTQAPALVHRQGHAISLPTYPESDFHTLGTTNLLAGNSSIQIGAAITDGSGVLAVTFPVAFADVPFVLCQSASPHTFAHANVVTASGATLNSYDTAGAGYQSAIYWIAIGRPA
jgi:hypothetical protein